ncbi:MAG: hypothetical protein ACM31C_09745 [Acidobacteriota bacterium]
MRLLALALVLASAPALADDDFGGATIIFARGGSLYRADPKGRNERELAKLPDKAQVRALRTDAQGKVLLVDLAGTWSYLPLDGAASELKPLPCADGPAQLAEDGACVFCRAATSGSQIVNLATGKVFPVQVPAPGTRLAGLGSGRKLVWADTGGVWTAPPGNPKQATRVAPEAPQRAFLPSPDGSRAVGVYPDEVYTDAHHKQAADVLVGFALDGEGARRKGIKDGIPVEWSHDNTWVLVQDGAKACLMRATGGEYKCWRGYTAASIASDGKFALVLGNRDGSKKQTPAKKDGKSAKKAAKKPAHPAEPAEGSEGEDADATAAPADVEVPPPGGPLALFRVRLEGSPYTEPPALVTKVVDGAAVWVPAKP